MVSEEQNSDVELASEVIPVPQVQPEAETVEVVNNDNDGANNISHRKPRQRKKVLYNAILKQMEFYFGDSNLSKDRFLAGLIKENPDVDLDIFLKFNKINTLTTDISKIAKALRTSTILKVSDDGTKVRRITPIVPKENTDDCTVYIQRLPSDADHEWLSTLFSEYGPVAYVSIPKFKPSNKIKGFAFVEFDTVEAAEKCLKAFREKGCELPSQTVPSTLLSISTFSEGEGQEENHDTNGNGTDSEKQKSEKSKAKKRKQSAKSDDPQDSDHSDCTKPKKKKCDEADKDSSVCHSDSNTEENNQSNKKRKRKSVQEGQDSETEVQSKEKSKKQKKLQDEEVESKKDLDNSESENNVENTEENVENATGEDAIEKKKKKKRKKNHHRKYEALEATDMGLQIMSKRDWKRLRNKYLNLQRSKMKQLKQHLQRAQWNQWGYRMDTDAAAAEVKDDNKKNLEFTPGVIVKVEFKEACIDPKGFKAELRSNTHVKYIDVKEGSIEAFIRCDSSEAAKELSDKTSNDRQFNVITGDEEKSYWDKIIRDREEKIGNKVRVKQRGRDKLLKKAEKALGKHIKFDEV